MLMENQSESLERLRKLFDDAPYPRMPLDYTPRDEGNFMFLHSMVTAFYVRDRRVIDTHGKVILDAGCGTGYKALALAEANPGAKIVGVDLSEESVKLARKRLEYHGFSNVEFHAMPLEDVPQLGHTYDYINCDEVLYLVPDPLLAMQSMQSVLQPDGLIRANLHSLYQRQPMLRAQEAFRLLGMMDCSKDERVKRVMDIMHALKPGVTLKARTWESVYEGPEGDGQLLANYLLDGDKGFTVSQTFDLLEAAGLELVSMVNWRSWEVTDLFQDPENLPTLWGMSLMDIELRDRLHLYELLHPNSRLLDFWCGHSNHSNPAPPLEYWEESDWQTARIHLHPQLRTPFVKKEFLSCLTEGRPFEFTRFIDIPAAGTVQLQGATAAALLPLWEAPQSLQTLTDRYLNLHPIDLLTLQPTNTDDALRVMRKALTELEIFLYVLIEPTP